MVRNQICYLNSYEFLFLSFFLKFISKSFLFSTHFHCSTFTPNYQICPTYPITSTPCSIAFYPFFLIDSNSQLLFFFIFHLLPLSHLLHTNSLIITIYFYCSINIFRKSLFPDLIQFCDLITIFLFH